MNLLLINVSLRPNNRQRVFPIGLGYIATAIKNAGVKMRIMDLDVRKYNYWEIRRFLIKEYHKEKYDTVVMGCIVTGYKYIKQIAELIRAVDKNITIICGNTVASSIPEILLKNTEVDIAVCGEGDSIIIDILKKGYKKGIYTGDIIKDIDTLPFIDWDLFDIEDYIRYYRNSVHEPLPIPYEELRPMPISSARGCLFKCTFCYQAFYNQGYRYRSVKNLGEEIDLLKKKYGINYISFCDDLTLFSKRRAEEFAEMLTGKDVFWMGDCRADLFSDDLELARKLKKSGCVSFGYSLESANKGILKSMNKRISLEDFSRQKKILDEAGIATLTSIVVGYPQETEETLKETFDYLYDNNIYPSTGYLLPQPGSPMYEWAKEHGFIKNEEEYLLSLGDRQDLRLNMTKIPNIEELVHGHLKRIRDKLHIDLDDDHLIKTGRIKGR